MAAMTLLLKVLVNAAALWAATRLVSGITYEGEWPGFLLVALVFGVVNAAVRPVVLLFSIPLLLLTLGLFTLVVNGFMLWLTSALSNALGLGFHVGGFWPAFFGALVVSFVSMLLSLLIKARGQKEE